mgnify:FL=1
MPNKFFAIIFVLALCSGCASYGNAVFANSSKVRKDIAESISSPEELVAKYGEPEQIFSHNGQQVYEYRYVAVSGFPEEEYADGAKHYQIDYIYVYFDDQILTQVENISRRGPFPPEDIFSVYRDENR